MVWHQESISGARAGTVIDEGLRQHMLRVYNFMASGLALTGIVAFFLANNQALAQLVLGTGLFWVLIIAQVGMVFFLSARISKIQPTTAQALFWVYSALMGVNVCALLLIYTGESVARVFFITAATFAATSIYGYTTKRDLSKFGSFLFMGLIGLIIASVVNMFSHSSALGFAISVAGVLLFTGLTAYDTQKIKEVYYEADSEAVMKKKAIVGALELYLNFINLFFMLMRLLGDRR